MENARDYTEELRRKIDINCAMDVLATNFDLNKPRRFIDGVCVSSGAKNSNGDAFAARGVNVTLPVPMLADHEWLRPIGKIIRIETRADQVLFRAEISNSGRLFWADESWMQMMCKFATGVSIKARNLADHPACDDTYFTWAVDEVSLTEKAADPGARILRVWERLPHVSLAGPSETVFWHMP